MIIKIIANLACSFIGTIAYAVMFQVPRRFYIGCGITGSVGWMMYKFASVYCSGCSCVLYRNGMCCIGCENADGPPEMSDHYLYDFWYHYTGAGSWHLFYSVLSGDKSVCNGCCERDRSNKSSFWDCAWNCLHCICPERSVPERILG